jgi:hypothetical protein
MAHKKVAFLTTYKTDETEPKPKAISVYQRKTEKPVKLEDWNFMSSMTCRNFSKDSYGYRDKFFVLSDQGITYNLPKHLSLIYTPDNQFQSTELRKIKFKPGKLNGNNKKIFKSMTDSSFNAITAVNKTSL